MRVRMRVSMSGSRDGETWPGVGATLVLGDDEARELQRAGIVDLVPGDDDAVHTVAEVDEATGRPVEDVEAADAAAEAVASVDERAVETATAGNGETAATDTGSSSRKAGRGGRRVDVVNPVVSSSTEETDQQVKAKTRESEGPRGIQPGQR